jgi:hypothetical protein
MELISEAPQSTSHFGPISGNQGILCQILKHFEIPQKQTGILKH